MNRLLRSPRQYNLFSTGTLGAWSLAVVLSVSMLFSSCAGVLTGIVGEAEAQAEKARDAVYTECGDSFYVKEKGNGMGLIEFWQYRDVTFEINEEMLTEVDKLNGIAWKGKSVMRSKAQRHRPSGGENKWSGWEQGGGHSFSLQKQNGQWKVGNACPLWAASGVPICAKVSCAEIAQ